MTLRNRTLVMTIGAIVMLAGPIVAKPFPIYIWNSSESVPVGLYRLRLASAHYVTELVAVRPPEPLELLSGPERLSANRCSDVEACAGSSRTNRLQNREHHHG